jgi:hypothetical protein
MFCKEVVSSAYLLNQGIWGQQKRHFFRKLIMSQSLISQYFSEATSANLVHVLNNNLYFKFKL